MSELKYKISVAKKGQFTVKAADEEEAKLIAENMLATDADIDWQDAEIELIEEEDFS